jgi:Lar family restriction alleviation protein
MSAVPILPCPFCGDADPAIDEIDNDCWAVCCNGCGAIGPCLADDGSKVLGAKAIELWNRRSA